MITFILHDPWLRTTALIVIPAALVALLIKTVEFVGWLLYGRPAPKGPRQADHGPSHPPTKPRDEQPQVDPPAEPRPGRHRGAPAANEVPPRPTTPPPVPQRHDAATQPIPRVPARHSHEDAA